MISSNHFITLYLAIELQSLSFHILTSTQRKSMLSIEAGLKYFILYGSSIIYAIIGSLNFNQIFKII